MSDDTKFPKFLGLTQPLLDAFKVPKQIAEGFAAMNGNMDGEFEGRIRYRVADGKVVALSDIRIYDDEARYTLTDLGEAYRRAMESGAKLNGAVKAGEKE